jgi:hypothetical protein
MEIVGKVVKRPFAVGSKSEREAVLLETAAGDSYLLRRQGGNAFYDATLDALVDQTVRCRGQLHGGTFITQDCEPLMDNE